MVQITNKLEPDFATHWAPVYVVQQTLAKSICKQQWQYAGFYTMNTLGLFCMDNNIDIVYQLFYEKRLTKLMYGNVQIS